VTSVYHIYVELSARFREHSRSAPPGAGGVARNLREGVRNCVLFAARCYASAALAVKRCLFVCLTVRHVRGFCQKNSRIVKLFSPSDSHTERHGNIPTGTPSPKGGVECRWGRQKSRFWANIYLHCVLWTVPAASAIHLAATDHGEFITLGPLVAGIKRPSLSMAGNNAKVYDKKPQRCAKDSRTAHLTARSDKPVAYVTNNKRLLDVLYCWS